MRRALGCATLANSASQWKSNLLFSVPEGAGHAGLGAGLGVVGRIVGPRLLQLGISSKILKLTAHAAIRLAQRGITQAAVNEAVQTAEATGQVASKVGKFGTVQNIYKGSNGITVVVETEGRNAGKVVTAFRTGSKP